MEVEGLESIRARGRGRRSEKGKEVRRSKSEVREAFPVQEVYSGDPEERKSDTTVLLG